MIRLSIIGDWYATADSFGKYVRHSEAKAEIDRLRGVLARLANDPMVTGVQFVDIARASLADGEGVGK